MIQFIARPFPGKLNTQGTQFYDQHGFQLARIAKTTPCPSRAYHALVTVALVKKRHELINAPSRI